MNTSEARMARLEDRIEEQVMRVDDVRTALASLEGRMDRRFDRVEARFDRVYGFLVAILIAILGGVTSVLATLIAR